MSTPPSASAAKRGGRAPALPPQERRQLIVDAVLPLLLERGANVTTREIAEAAGVAEGTLFRVFDDKAALLHAVAQALLDADRTRRTLSEIDPTLSLDAMVRAVAELLLHSMEQVMSVLGALRGIPAPTGRERPAKRGPPAFVSESHRAMLEGMTELFSRYQDQLAIPPARAALLLRALLFGSRVPWCDPRGGLSSDEIASALVTGIGVRP